MFSGTETGDLETVKKGTPLYGQPAWWGEDHRGGHKGAPDDNPVKDMEGAVLSVQSGKTFVHFFVITVTVISVNCSLSFVIVVRVSE